MVRRVHTPTQDSTFFLNFETQNLFKKMFPELNYY